MHADAAPPFPASLVYPDVAEEILAREEAGYRTAQTILGNSGAWSSYLQRMLPPVRPDPVVITPDAAELATPWGMARFLLSTGPSAAEAFAEGMRATAAATRDLACADFWSEVVDEIAQSGGCQRQHF